MYFDSCIAWKVVLNDSFKPFLGLFRNLLRVQIRIVSSEKIFRNN